MMPQLKKEPDAHQERHKLLHQMFNELLADYLAHAKPVFGASRTSLQDSIYTLMQWSARQMQEPDHEELL